MSLRYSKIEIFFKRIFRYFLPIQKSSYTIGEVEDICTINLVPPERLKSFFVKCITLLKRHKGEDIGDYLEFGVFNGSSLGSMYLTMKDTGANMRLFGFDAFQGLPKESEQEDEGVWGAGYYSCSFEKMKVCLMRRGVDTDKIHWIDGRYCDTLNENTINKYKIKNPGIIFVDCDTYSSSTLVLNFIAPLLTQPAILCFDDWKLNNLDITGHGEYRSFNEFLERHTHLQAREIPSYNRKSKSFLVLPSTM